MSYATKEDINKLEVKMEKGFGGVYDRQDHTNGTVSKHDKMLWTSLGALPLLTIWAWWLTMGFLDSKDTISNVQRLEIQAAVSAGIDAAFDANGAQLKLTPEK